MPDTARPMAVLWDMDGTLVDTEPLWMATEEEMAAVRGVHWTHADAMGLVGNDLIDSAIYIRARLGMDESPGEIVELLLDGVVARLMAGEVPWRPGARELLSDLQSNGVPCALVTMSYLRFVAPILAQLPPEAFHVIVTGEQVEKGKPHPEPYQTAAAALGLSPQACLAIEDSNTGATSAEAAGCTVVVVENHVPVGKGPRRVFLDTLEGLSYETLPSLLG